LKKTISIATISATLGALATLGVIGMAGCGGGARPFAVVNGEAITLDDFYQYLKTKPSIRVQTQNGAVEAQVADTIAFQGLQDVVANRLIMQMAKDQGVYPTDQEVAAELEFRKKGNPNYVFQMTAIGHTLESIKQSIALDLTKEKLITKGITVSAQDAEEYKKQNPDKFMNPATVELTGILVATDADKAKVDADLGAGESFKTVAAKYTKFRNGGQLGTQPMTAFDSSPDIAKALGATPEQGTTGWLKAAEGWMKFYISKKTPASPVQMDANKMEVLRRRLALERGAAAIDLSARLIEKLKKSTIDVSEKSLKDAWTKSYEQMMKKDQVNVSTPKVGDEQK